MLIKRFIPELLLAELIKRALEIPLDGRSTVLDDKATSSDYAINVNGRTFEPKLLTSVDL